MVFMAIHNFWVDKIIIIIKIFILQKEKGKIFLIAILMKKFNIWIWKLEHKLNYLLNIYSPDEIYTPKVDKENYEENNSPNIIIN